MYKRIAIIIFVFLFLLTHPSKAVASGTITIVNPLRGPQLGLENQDLVASLKSQWQYTKDASVSATWLWQYSALENNQMTNLAKAEMQNQEHGIFLEIDKNTAQKSEVQYRGKNQWYHSDGLLLVSYDLYERHKIIDTTFNKFKSVFGYYPTSVGAWWVGAEPIEYMKQKYGITAVLQCSDQFNTDAYSIWGTPWSIPYLSRPDNATVPAKDYESSSKAVVMQWAPRDPNRAYGDSVTHSTFSMQDYATKGYDLRYIQYLQDIFLKKAGDQLVFGLEGGIIPEGYRDYGKQVAQTKGWEKEGRLQLRTMKEYATQFLNAKQILPPTAYFISKDYENNNQTIWYNSSFYRAGIQRRGDKVYLFDVRDYKNTSSEDFNVIPNTQKSLRINTKAVVDSVRFPQQEKQIAQDTGILRIEEEGIYVTVFDGQKNLVTFAPKQLFVNDEEFPFDYKENHTLQLQYTQQAQVLLKIEKISKEFKAWKESVSKSKRNIVINLWYGFILLGLLTTTVVLFKTGNKKLATLIPLLVIIIPSMWLYQQLKDPENSILTSYEIEALTKLRNSHKKVIYLAPNQTVEYRARTPFIYAKSYLAEKLSKTKWQYYTRKKDQPMTLNIDHNAIILVPRYLGQELYSNEIGTLNVKKTFDNAQIELYEKR